MGKSTVALWLQELGVPVLDSDQVGAAGASAACRKRPTVHAHLQLAPTARWYGSQLLSPVPAALLPSHASPQVVHQLYGSGGAAVAPVEAAFPGVAVDGGGFGGACSWIVAAGKSRSDAGDALRSAHHAALSTPPALQPSAAPSSASM